MEFTYPKKVRFSCNKCGLCCGDTELKTRHILLLKAEAEHIESKTDLKRIDFSSPYEDKPPYPYEMKKTKEGKCIFFKENRCSIYLLRPIICKFYPFDLKFDQKSQVYAFDFTLECPSIDNGDTWEKKDFSELFMLAKQKFERKESKAAEVRRPHLR